MVRTGIRLFVVLLAVTFPAIVWAGERVALVIGMGDYRNVASLKNTVNDARAISAALDSIGFKVTTVIDATHDELRKTIDDFAFRSETAELALIYFAGHGVEVQGENFLIPVDANIKSNTDIQKQSVSLKDFLRAVDRARKMRIVILDSCRNNPFGDLIRLDVATPSGGGDASTRSIRRGLAPPTPDRGTLVAFAARDGEVALDGDGDNSPFAMALVDKLTRPGLEISLMFRQVRDQVLKTTHNLQEPHTYGSLSGIPFYIAGPTDDQRDAEAVDRRVAWSAIRPEQEQQLAKLAQGGDTRSMLGLAYIRLNPEEDRFAPEKAVDYLTRAAAAGSSEAQFELAKLYETGIGVEQDPKRALELFRQSAENDFPDALNDLGFMYYQGGLGLARDTDKALALFERAADLRHPQAMFNFAALIDDGLVATKGPEDAAQYLYMALRSGSADVFKILNERPKMFTSATRKALQAKLSEYGFYKGSIDGDFGPGTKRGVRAAYGLSD
ncbi:MAG: caspase family protein [Paracoccaceae bacterium]